MQQYILYSYYKSFCMLLNSYKNMQLRKLYTEPATMTYWDQAVHTTRGLSRLLTFFY